MQFRVFSSALAILLVLSACAPAATPVVSEIAEVVELQPTLEEPTATLALPTSTPTAEPSPTPVPTLTTPNLLSSFASNVNIEFYDPFDMNNGWGLHCDCYFRNGLFTINGRDWNGAPYQRNQFEEGQGIIIDFRFTEGTVADIAIEVDEEFNTSPYRSLGFLITDGVPRADLWAGTQPFSGQLGGNLLLQSDTFYSLAILIGSNGEFLVLVWDREDPTQFLSSHERIGSSWANRVWHLGAGGNSGRLELDNFRIISFDHISN